MTFTVDDIRGDEPFLDVEMYFDQNSQPFRYTRRQWRARFAEDDAENIEQLRRKILESERLSDRPRNLLRDLESSQILVDTDNFSPSLNELKKSKGASTAAPNCIFFSTNRAIVSDASTPKSKAAGGEAAAYAEALSSRPLYLSQFADWMRVQEQLALERPISGRHLEVMRSAVSGFLPSVRNIRPDLEEKPRLLIEKGEITLDVRQLSDGERGILGLVLDIARRLSQANQSLDDPLREGEAIVLIDEIDLHLHPTWQRQIIQNLTTIFPRCQFIVTSHSPQVIGEVEHDRIQIIAGGQVYSPSHSFGVDASRVLEEIMGAAPRTEVVQDLLATLSRAIGDAKYSVARRLLFDLASQVGENDPEVTRAETLLEFMED
jgi:hypothetical protein